MQDGSAKHTLINFLQCSYQAWFSLWTEVIYYLVNYAALSLFLGVLTLNNQSSFL